MALSAYAKQQALRMRTQAMFPYLLEITLQDSTILRYSNTTTDKTFEGNTYTASYFSVTPPEQTESSISNAKLTISSVDGYWIEKIRKTQYTASGKKITARFIASICYTKDGTEYIEAVEDNMFTLSSAQWGDSTEIAGITWDMTFDDNLNILVPCDTASSLNVPGVA